MTACRMTPSTWCQWGSPRSYERSRESSDAVKTEKEGMKKSLEV